MVDYHMHSALSGDSDEPAESILQAAIQGGLTDICFTEHVDLYFPGIFDFSIDLEAYDAMRARIEKLTPEGLNVRFGMEAGLYGNVLDETRELLKRRSWDFIIGSVHIVDGLDTFEQEYFVGKTLLQAYRRYLEVVLENITQYDDYDVVGHLDYVAKSAPSHDVFFRYADYADLLDAILRHAVSEGKGIEINTSVYRFIWDARHFLDVLRRYRELGGKIVTIGSDAHAAQYVGYGFKRARDLLREAGFRAYAVYQGRTPRFVKI